MDRRTFQTPLGEIWLWGAPEAFEGGPSPAIVMLTGAFAAPQTLRAIPALVPETPVLIGDMPGNRCPWLIVQSVGAYAAAYSAAIRALDRPVVLCGASLGGTLALAARAPNLRAVLALEPLLGTSEAAILWPGFRSLLADGDGELRDFLWAVFRIDEARAEPRDYSAVLDHLEVPAAILAGGSAGTVPSLLSAQDTARIRANPRLTYRKVLGVGHDITLGATSVVVEALRQLVRAAGPT